MRHILISSAKEIPFRSILAELKNSLQIGAAGKISSTAQNEKHERIYFLF